LQQRFAILDRQDVGEEGRVVYLMRASEGPR